MNRIRLMMLLLITALVLAACGNSSTGPNEPGNPDPGDPGPGDPPPPTGECRVTVTDDFFTAPIVLENGPEACDYYFPGDSSARKHWHVHSDVVIEPGAVLVFGPNAILRIADGGSLTAVGTAAERITFEGSVAEHGHWYGLCFSANGESRLEFVDVRFGGGVSQTGQRICRGGIGGSGSIGEPVHIKHSSVSGSYTNGLNVHRLNLGQFENNSFFGNREYGVNIEAAQVFKLDTASDYLGADSGAVNGRPFVYAGGPVSSPGFSQTWRNLNAPYFVSDDDSPYLPNITVSDDTHLVLEAGVNIVFEGLSELSLFGSGLFAEGTSADPVVLRGASGEPGSWNGLRLINSGANIEHLHVLWGGNPSTYQGSLVIGGSVMPGSTVSNVLIDGSEGCAVRFHNPGQSSPADFDLFDVEYGGDNEQGYCEGTQ